MSVPYILEAGESLWAMSAGGPRAGFLVRGSDSGERLLVLHFDAPAGFLGPARHLHRDVDEGFLVLEGKLRVAVGDDRHDLTAGAFAWVPGGVPHGFANVSDAPARFLCLVAPPGQLEAMFHEIADYVVELDGPPDPERMAEINRRHGVEIVGPPVGTEG
ncbi:MAG: cupin domain-containing protein [Actinomycetota bacterium]|nr:cupin domain-containing protein [Actinomycetota bacterium]